MGERKGSDAIESPFFGIPEDLEPENLVCLKIEATNTLSRCRLATAKSIAFAGMILQRICRVHLTN